MVLDEPLLSLTEVADLLRLPKRSVRYLVNAGRLRAVRFSEKGLRFRRADVEEMLSEAMVGRR